MRKIVGLACATAAMVVLSGCDIASELADDASGGDGSNSYQDVYLSDLEQGYAITGYNNKGEVVALTYCNRAYTYTRTETETETFAGTFSIDYDEVEMRDAKGGSYVLIGDGDQMLRVGSNYACTALSRDLTIGAITKLDDCY